MTFGLIDLFLHKMLPRWPEGYGAWEQDVLVGDTKTAEIQEFAPELLEKA